MNRLLPPLLLLLAMLGAGAIFWAVTAPGQDRIALAHQQMADLNAEAAALEQRIAEFNGAGDGAALPDTLLLPGTDAADAALGLQQRLVDLAAAHGLTLSSFGDAPAPADLSHPAVSVRIEGEGRMADVTAFLDALERQSPRIGISQLLLRAPSVGDGNPDGRVVVLLAAWGFAPERAG
jgi:hypothetical protein